jgi:hypothetical protein
MTVLIQEDDTETKIIRYYTNALETVLVGAWYHAVLCAMRCDQRCAMRCDLRCAMRCALRCAVLCDALCSVIRCAL